MIPMTGKTIYYIYDANGTKLQRLVKNGTTVLEDRSYVDGIEYNGNTFDFAQTSEGRVMAIAVGTYHKYEYFLKDHLGNIRATFSDLTGGHNISPDDILQTNDYFPFGRSFILTLLQEVKTSSINTTGKNLRTMKGNMIMAQGFTIRILQGGM